MGNCVQKGNSVHIYTPAQAANIKTKEVKNPQKVERIKKRRNSVHLVSVNYIKTLPRKPALKQSKSWQDIRTLSFGSKVDKIE